MELSARTKSWACIGFLAFASSLSLFAQGDHFNTRGNVLIADQFNNRVIEVDRHGNIVWQFGLGPADFSPASVMGANDAQRVGKLTLTAGTATPPPQLDAPP